LEEYSSEVDERESLKPDGISDEHFQEVVDQEHLFHSPDDRILANQGKKMALTG